MFDVVSHLTTDLQNLPPLRHVIKSHNLNAKKSLGQNFLLDLNVTQKIARSVLNSTCENGFMGHNILEIGPGPGGLTRALLGVGTGHITAIEYDQRCIAALQPLCEAAQGRLRLIDANALEFDYENWFASQNSKPVIVANLPYNIATPLLITWLRHINKISAMGLMFQREVADRIVAPPCHAARGRLSVMCQWLCKTRKIVTLPASAFTPKPKVNSAVVAFTPHAFEHTVSFEAMEQVVTAAFGQRRKMLRKSLSCAFGDDTNLALETTRIDPTRRAETLDVDDFVSLARLLPIGKNIQSSINLEVE